MPTITNLLGIVMVMGIFLAAVVLFVRVLSQTAAQNRQAVKVNLVAWRFRLHVSIMPTRSRVEGRPAAQDEHIPPPAED